MKEVQSKEFTMNAKQFQEYLVNNPKASLSDLASATGRSSETVRKARVKLGLPAYRETSQNRRVGLTPQQQFEIDREKLRLSYEEKGTGNKYQQALRVIEQLTEERENILSIKKNIQTFKIRPTNSKGSEATAVWLASDWHVGEKVTRGQTNGINEYNPDISKKRGEQYFTHGLSLTKMMGRDVEVKTIVLALLGDFITGHLHTQAVETNYLAPAEETRHAQSIIASGIEYILANSDYDLKIVCASGNHGRTTKFSEFGSENGHSWEYFMYCNLRDRFETNPRVEFIISEGAHTYVDIYNYKVRFLHGHDIKFGGGVGGITIPFKKAVAQWDIAIPAYLTCAGHFHQRFDGGNFMVNGSMIGYNSFALSIKASAEVPAQQMFLIDKKRGKTIVAPILFDL